MSGFTIIGGSVQVDTFSDIAYPISRMFEVLLVDCKVSREVKFVAAGKTTVESASEGGDSASWSFAGGLCDFPWVGVANRDLNA
jgi:hypothetical protein